MQQLRIFFRFLCNGKHRVNEGIQCLFAFALSRFDHQRFMNDEREIIRRRVEFVIHQALGNIQRMDLRSVRQLPFENEFMHARTVKGQRIDLLQRFHHVVGVQRGEFAHPAQTFFTKHQDIDISLDHNAEMAPEGADLAQALFRHLQSVERRQFVGLFLKDAGDRSRNVVRQEFLCTDRTGTRTAAAVRGGEGLMQIEVHHIEAEIPRTGDAQQGVHVGTVAVYQAAGLVHHLVDFGDVFIKEPESVRVGDHDPGQLVIAERSQFFEVDVAAGIGRDRFDDQAAHGGSRRIGAVGAVRDQHDLPLIMAHRLMPGDDGLDAAELTVRTGCGRQRAGIHAADTLEHVLQFIHQQERTLDRFDRLQRMDIDKTVQTAEFFIDLRVVFHRAGTERVEAVIQ